MDPLTIAKYGLKAGSTIANMVGAQVQKKKDQKFGDFMIQQAEKTPMYQMSDTYNKYLAMAKQDPVGDYMKEQAARNQGTSVAALKSGGAKSILGGLGAVQQQAYADQMDAVARGQANLQQALQTYAGAEQDIMNKNVGQKEQRLQGIFQGELYKKMAKDTAREAMFSGGQDLANTGLDFLTEYKTGKAASEAAAAAAAAEAAAPAAAASGAAAAPAPAASGAPALPATGDGYTTSGNPKLDEMMYDMMFLQGFNLRNGGVVPKTPGDFSHSSNPIDIVRKGRKIGEMTGGEYVLNPAQAAKMQSLASSKKKEALQRYVTGLFNKFNAK